MNHPIVFRTLSVLLLILAVALTLTGAVAVYYREASMPYLMPAGIIAVLGFFGVLLITTDASSNVGAREAGAIVVFTWTMYCVIGALPFILQPDTVNALSIPDALFESASGFTTTGSTIFADVERLPRGMLFWRSLTHWLGGMGIVVLAIAIIPFLGFNGVLLMGAEAPGPEVERLTPRISQTAQLFWAVYVGMTAVESLLLIGGGMGIFDAINHSFATVATGGFSTRNASIASWDSPYIEGVVTAFMVLSGINFALYFRLLIRDFGRVRRDSELRVYLTMYLVSVAVVTAALLAGGTYTGIGRAVRYGSFQVATLMTSTGFATADYVLWPGAARGVLLLMLFIGGSLGSTSGGIKVFHITVLAKAAWREVKRIRYPGGVFALRLNQHPMAERLVYAVAGFFFLYLTLVILSTIVVASANVDLETALTATLAAIGNIGPGFSRVGPTENFGFLPDWTKLWLVLVMVAGRLEIYTLLIFLAPDRYRAWR